MTPKKVGDLEGLGDWSPGVLDSRTSKERTPEGEGGVRDRDRSEITEGGWQLPPPLAHHTSYHRPLNCYRPKGKGGGGAPRGRGVGRVPLEGGVDGGEGLHDSELLLPLRPVRRRQEGHHPPGGRGALVPGARGGRPTHTRHNGASTLGGFLLIC